MQFNKLQFVLNMKPLLNEETKDFLKAVKNDDVFEAQFLIDRNPYIVYDFDQVALHSKFLIIAYLKYLDASNCTPLGCET